MPATDNQYGFESLFKAVEMTKNIAAKACDEVERQRADMFVRDATRVLDGYGWVIRKLNQAREKNQTSPAKIDLLEESIATDVARVIERMLSRYRDLYDGLLGARAFLQCTSKTQALSGAMFFIDYVSSLRTHAEHQGFGGWLEKKLASSYEIRHLFRQVQRKLGKEYDDWINAHCYCFGLSFP